MTNWSAWRLHAAQKIADEGQFLCLTNENWEPICTLPAVHELTGGGLRLEASDLSVRMPAMTNGAAHTVVDELIAQNLGVFAEDGRLIPNLAAARSIVIQRAGQRSRQAYFISHTLAEGGAENPSVITPAGQDLLGLLAATPCPSVPRKWGNEPMTTWTQDAGGTYEKPRIYGAVEMADELDGYTMHGMAVPTISTLIQDSVDAVCRQMKWTTPHIAVDMGTDAQSPEIMIQVNDQTIWEAIAEPARLSGVTVSAYLWWPGDDPVTVRPSIDQTPIPTTWAHPISIVRVESSKEA